jgi:hypothetical protein
MNPDDSTSPAISGEGQKACFVLFVRDGTASQARTVGISRERLLPGLSAESMRRGPLNHEVRDGLQGHEVFSSYQIRRFGFTAAFG